MNSTTLLDSFDSTNPVFAMLHLKGESPAQKLEIAKRETEMLWAGGVDAVIVENYYGSVDDVVRVCDYLRTSASEVVFGINVLKDDWRAFALANEYGARFIQLDSVAGHLAPAEDGDFAARLAEERRAADTFVLGGVRFKYQPYLSGRSLTEDLLLGMARADAIVVTGEGTGKETPLEKTAEFRRNVGGEYPLIVGAGVTVDNCRRQLESANAVIVGSYLKDTYQDTGDVDPAHVRSFVDAIRALSVPADSGVTA
jgi:predicted TIM-barrel enzyme